MQTPESIKSHEGDYKNYAWQQYTVEELGQWVHLLLKRSGHRENLIKRWKDIQDAQNYLAMIQAHVDHVKSEFMDALHTAAVRRVLTKEEQSLLR